MASKTPDQFALFAQEEQEPDKEMPAKLEVVDYHPAPRGSKTMSGGAYNPYERTAGSSSDTVRQRKPRVDLRQLSEWIKTTQQVKALRQEDVDPKKDGGP